MGRLHSFARSKRPTKCCRVPSAELPTIEPWERVAEWQRLNPTSKGPIGKGELLATPTDPAAAKVGVRGHPTQTNQCRIREVGNPIDLLTSCHSRVIILPAR